MGASGGAGPCSAADAVAMVLAGLAFLASADMACVPAAALAEWLRGLERAGSMHTAARARALSAFAGQHGFEDDGQGSAGAWLAWQARVTRGAAAGAVAWARRLAAHPAVAGALAAGEISASWAREICGWTARLPADKRADADEVLLAARQPAPPDPRRTGHARPQACRPEGTAQHLSPSGTSARFVVALEPLTPCC
jgi:hypothetical protein